MFSYGCTTAKKIIEKFVNMIHFNYVDINKKNNHVCGIYCNNFYTALFPNRANNEFSS
jgi:hypothetical protein